MSQQHIKSILPLRQWCNPIDPENTVFLSHYDITDEDITGIKPLGPHPDDPRIIGYWDFSVETDRAYDLSNNGHEGTIHDPTWDTGIQGKSLNFNATDGKHVDYGNILQHSGIHRITG